MPGSTRATAVARAGSGESSPVYQATVLAALPATNAVAVSNGGPATRCGGLLALAPKKLSAAAMAEAAAKLVFASLPIEAVTAACRLPAVAAGVAPMVNW